MGLEIAKDDATRVLEEAVALARDASHEPSQLWLDRVAGLEAWTGNKLALTAFGTAVLAKATEPDVDPLALIDRSGDAQSYNARLFARDVLVPNATRLGFLLGTPGPDPLAGSPWFGPERIDDIDKWRPSAKQRADDLVGWLAGLDQSAAKLALVAFVRLRMRALERQIEQRKQSLVAAGAVVPLEDLGAAVDRFIGRNPEHGRRGAAAAAAAFTAAGGRVVARPVHDPGQIDVDVLDRAGLLTIGIEVKQKAATEQDALDIAAGVRAQGATRAVLCAFGQGTARLPDDRLIAQADREHGVFLHIVYATADLIRLAAILTSLPRPEVLRAFPTAFAEHYADLDGSDDGLAQWRSITDRWTRAATVGDAQGLNAPPSLPL
ncbi:restriction endonuclease, SacI family [Patulibacter sp. NPDC049589]|uniref:restriction endonuclease, SacI family n=1 Tax=Patulibacter sp. NPDC049589 TaxID=3154731 RepID=UPI0034364F20